MTTAREKLFHEIVALLAAPAGNTAEAEVRKIMGRYRVQTKPGVHVPDGTTARDALGDRLLSLWRENGPDAQERIGTTIDEFRMQTKQRTSPAKASTAAPKTTAPPVTTTKPSVASPAPPNGRPASAPPVVEKSLSAAQSARPRRAAAEPVAGGPRRRGKTRSECPKCHSMGVVLAQSYAGDEYFSCIYCGWQAYRPAEDGDPTASLAMRLLGQAASEK